MMNEPRDESGDFVPWEDVETAAGDRRLQRKHQGSNEGIEAPSCPGCGRPPSELTWLYFSSPHWTWQNLCGRAGWLVICRPCHLQVEFFMEVIS